MLPLLLKLYVGRLGDAGAPLHPRIESELKNHFDYMSAALGKARLLRRQHVLAPPTSSSPSCSTRAPRAARLPAIPISCALHARLKARPAYIKAIERGGPFELGR